MLRRTTWVGYTTTTKTCGAYTFKNFKEVCNELQLNVKNLVSVFTDGAPSRKSKKEGFGAFLKKVNLKKMIISLHYASVKSLRKIYHFAIHSE